MEIRKPGWFKDSGRHSEAARKGWLGRKDESEDKPISFNGGADNKGGLFNDLNNEGNDLVIEEVDDEVVEEEPVEESDLEEPIFDSGTPDEIEDEEIDNLIGDTKGNEATTDNESTFGGMFDFKKKDKEQDGDPLF